MAVVVGQTNTEAVSAAREGYEGMKGYFGRLEPVFETDEEHGLKWAFVTMF